MDITNVEINLNLANNLKLSYFRTEVNLNNYKGKTAIQEYNT